MARRLFPIAFSALAFFSFASCGGGVPLTAPEGAELHISANPTAIPVFGGLSVITVLGFKGAEDGGGPLPDGTQIFFTTNVGIIEERVEMVNGMAVGNLRSNGRAGNAIVIARSGAGVEATLGGGGEGSVPGVLIGNAAGINILVTANPPTITPPNTTTEIVATVFDNDNNRMPDVPIIFTTNAGALASMSTTLRTNANGQATDRLTLLNESSATVTAFSGAGEGSASGAVTVNRGEPAVVLVTSIRPSSGAPGDTMNVTINGANFQPGAVVSFDEGIAVNSVTFVSTGQLIANITIDTNVQNTSVARTVTVTNPDGGEGSLANAFTIVTPNPAPVITSLSPNSTTERDPTFETVTINGFNFQAGAQVLFSHPTYSVNVLGTTFNSASQMEVDVTVDPAGSGGPPIGTVFQVRVRNPDGLQSNAVNFTWN